MNWLTAWGSQTYPFTLSPPVVAKLQFVQIVVTGSRNEESL